MTTGGDTIQPCSAEEITLSEQSENVFAAARGISTGFFSKANESTPRLAEGLIGLRSGHVRAWAEGVGTWLELGEGFFQTLQVKPKISGSMKQMTRGAAETWIKAEEELLTGGLDVSRQCVRVAAAGAKMVSTAGFRLADATVTAVRARRTAEPKVAAAPAKRSGAKH